MKILDGKPYMVKAVRTVWVGVKSGDHIKRLPIDTYGIYKTYILD